MRVNTQHLKSGHSTSCGCYRPPRRDLKGTKIGKLTPFEYISGSKWRCKCDCGNIVEVKTDRLVSKATQSCGCDLRSHGEKAILDLLQAHNIKFLKDKGFFKNLVLPTGGLGRYDFILLNEQGQPYHLIEFDGRQHFKKCTGEWENRVDLEMRQKCDKAKNEYALSHNIPLVRIPYWELKNLTFEMLFDEKFLVKEEKNNDIS